MKTMKKPEPMADMNEYVTMFGAVLPQVKVEVVVSNGTHGVVLVDNRYRITWVSNGYWVETMTPVTGGGYHFDSVAKFSFYDAFRHICYRLALIYIDEAIEANIMSHDPSDDGEE